MLTSGIELHRRQGAADWQLEDVRETGDRVAVAYSWRAPDGSRASWAQVLSGRPRITLKYSDGRSIRTTEGKAPPFWLLEGRPRPRGWPLVRVPHEGLLAG